MATKKIPTVFDLKEVIAKARREWFTNNSADEIIEEVHSTLTEKAKDIILKAFGMRHRPYRGYEFGDGGSDPIWKHIEINAHKAAEQWIKKYVGEFDSIVLPERAMNDVKKAYMREFKYKVSEIAIEMAKERAEKEAEALIKEACNLLDNETDNDSEEE